MINLFLKHTLNEKKPPDHAKIPVYLWKNQLTVPGVTDANRDTEFGHRWFLRGLVWDCLEYIRTTYGSIWGKPHHTPSGQATELGKDWEAVAGILWHSVHTTWDDYHVGSRLVHFRFLSRYQKMARNGVEVYFERPGPTTRDKQPNIANPKVRMAKAKILKVVQRRYLRTTGFKVKSLIKYFAVPKGDEDIRLVSNATANHLNECVWVSHVLVAHHQHSDQGSMQRLMDDG